MCECGVICFIFVSSVYWFNSIFAYGKQKRMANVVVSHRKYYSSCITLYILDSTSAPKYAYMAWFCCNTISFIMDPNNTRWYYFSQQDICIHAKLSMGKIMAGNNFYRAFVDVCKLLVGKTTFSMSNYMKHYWIYWISHFTRLILFKGYPLVSCSLSSSFWKMHLHAYARIPA